VCSSDLLNARSEQRRDNVALQEIDDGSAVVGGDKDTFGHESFLDKALLHAMLRNNSALIYWSQLLVNFI
jgi:hypothetical protein